MKRNTDDDSRFDTSVLPDFITDTRGVSDTIGQAMMIGIVVLLGGLILAFATGFIGDTLEEQPRAQIDTDPGSDEVDLIVRSTSNLDDMEIRVNGSTDNAAADLAGEVGETATVDADGNGLSPGDRVTVVGIKDAGTSDPTNATVLEYEH